MASIQGLGLLTISILLVAIVNSSHDDFDEIQACRNSCWM